MPFFEYRHGGSVHPADHILSRALLLTSLVLGVDTSLAATCNPRTLEVASVVADYSQIVASERILAISSLSEGKISIFRCNEATECSIASEISSPDSGPTMALTGNLLCFGNAEELYLYDLSCSERPLLVSTTRLHASTAPTWIGISGRLLVVATGAAEPPLPEDQKGIFVFDITKGGQEGALSNIQDPTVTDARIVDGRLVVVSYAKVRCFDLTNPSKPNLVWELPLKKRQRVAVLDEFLLFAGDRTLDVYRATADNIRFVSSVTYEGGDLDAPVKLNLVGRTLYIADREGFLSLIDIRDPSSPRVVSSTRILNFLTDMAGSNSSLYLAAGGDVVWLDDVACRPSDRIIPVAANAAGRDGTYYTSSVMLANPTPQSLGVVLEYWPRNEAVLRHESRTLQLQPASATEIPNLIGDLFGESGTAGPVAIYCDPRILVMSTTQEQKSGSLQPVPPIGILPLTGERMESRFLLSGRSHYYNLAVINTAQRMESFEVSASLPTGAVTKTLSIGAQAALQIADVYEFLQIPREPTVILLSSADNSLLSYISEGNGNGSFGIRFPQASRGEESSSCIAAGQSRVLCCQRESENGEKSRLSNR